MRLYKNSLQLSQCEAITIVISQRNWKARRVPVGSYEKMMTGRLFSKVKLPFRVGVEKPARNLDIY